jgi:hypothetical protein
MMSPVAGKPLHFTANGLMFAPLFVADPQSGPTQPYHMYVRRHEPAIVFGTLDAGVANTQREDGASFLDAVWTGAPFRNHAQFMTRVERTATEWQAAGRMSSGERTQVTQAARRAAQESSELEIGPDGRRGLEAPRRRAFRRWCIARCATHGARNESSARRPRPRLPCRHWCGRESNGVVHEMPV